jgi:hypothetical protein
MKEPKKMEKSEITKMREEEFNFLKEELKKMDAQIKEFGYKSGTIQTQEKLWELREKVNNKINEFIRIYPALFK